MNIMIFSRMNKKKYCFVDLIEGLRPLLNIGKGIKMEDLEKDVLLKDCFSVDELQSVEFFLSLMKDFYLMSDFFPE